MISDVCVSERVCFGGRQIRISIRSHNREMFMDLMVVCKCRLFQP